MPWVIGIDEAGYGPNLGPLVQTAVAVRLPATDPAGWETLRAHIRRGSEKDDGRVLIDDSKRVHVGVHGVARLERGLAATVGLPAGSLGEWLHQVALPEICHDLAGEPWFDPAESLPLFPGPVPNLRAAFAELGIEARVTAVSLVCAPLFNQVITGSGSKATILTAGVCGLLQAAARSVPAGEPMLIHGDQLGGRRFYGPLLQAAFPDAWAVAELEGPGESRYRLERLGREVTVVFRPRAEADSVAVALASMLAKYLREVAMRQFNRFWAQHVPDLKPTAGYPVDAKRYLDAIRPAMQKLGIPEDRVWRMK